MKKKNLKKIIIFSIFLTVGFLICFHFSYASSQVDWPTSPMGTALTSEYKDTSLTTLVKYIYEWGISLGALAAFISIIVAGFNYLTSAGNSSKINEAKKRITASFLGLALLLGTFLILNTINPEITSLEIKTNVTETNSLEGVAWTDPEYETECAYAKLYIDSDYMEQDEEKGYPINGDIGKTIDKLNTCVTKWSLTETYNAVQFISTIRVYLVETTFDENGKPIEKPKVEVFPGDKKYPEAMQSLLLNYDEDDIGDRSKIYYTKAMGTECQLYLLTKEDCSEFSLFGSAKVSFPTKDLASTSNLDPILVRGYKLVRN